MWGNPTTARIMTPCTRSRAMVAEVLKELAEFRAILPSP